MSESSADTFVSTLGKGREAFHAEVTEYCLRVEERTPEDFLRHFPCASIMKALEARPMERARIVSQATGVHEKVATKMSPEASGEALQIALDERITSSSDIVRLFQPDDRQRYLERHALWAFNVEGQPWKATAANKAAHDRAKAYLAYILERGLENLLCSHEEVVGAITVGKLAQCLPKDKLGSIIELSLKKTDKFTEEDLIEAVPPKSLVEHVALDYLWERVITPLIAEAHDYARKPITAIGASTMSGLSSNPTSSAPDSNSGWDDEARRSLRPADETPKTESNPQAAEPPLDKLENAPLSGSTVSEDEIVSDDDLIASEITDEEVSSSSPPPNPSVKKITASERKKANQN
jgi:hypothetical protein